MVEKGEPDSTDPSRLIAISNLKYSFDENLTRQCADFTVAAINWLLRREAMVGIPPRDLRMFSLSTTAQQRTQLFVMVVVLMPALAAALGLWVWWRRRA